MENIILIGMPGAGKSTVGVILAKTLGYTFADTDLLLQEQQKSLLQTMIDQIGVAEFIRLEGELLAGLSVESCVVSTGGSAVYSEKGMLHLKEIGTVVYLDLPFEELERRINNIKTRGIAMEAGKTLYDLYRERIPLYQKYADITINCNALSVEQCVERVVREVE